MQGHIRAKQLITHFIIVKVNTVFERRSCFSSALGNEARQRFLQTDPLWLISAGQSATAAP